MKVFSLIFVGFFVIVFVDVVQPANVLLSAEYGAGSHFLLFAKMGEELVNRGHNVTFLIGQAYAYRIHQAPYKDLFNFVIIDHARPHSEVFGAFKKFGGLYSHSSIAQVFSYEDAIRDVYLDDCRKVLADDALTSTLAHSNYDIVVFDVIWMCGALIAQKLTIPSVAVVAGLAMQTAYPYAGIPINPAYMPIVSTGFSNHMNFFERLVNLFMVWMVHYGQGTPYYTGKHFSPIKDEFNIRPDLSMDELLSEVDMWFVANDFALEFSAPLTPNVIPVGGFTAGPAGNLSKELVDYIDSAGDHGIIIFTLGTYCAAVDQSILKIFADAFAEVDQKIIWQIEDTMKRSLNFDLPDNVKMFPWIPQNNLLGHSKTRLMMYHGGNNGLHEALYHGVPLIMVPIIGDQHDTAARVVERGTGLRITRQELSKLQVVDSLKEVLSNNKYKEKALQLSSIYRHRPQTATERAAFWIEHVIQFGGQYMKSPVPNISLFKLYLIDIILFLALIGGMFFYVIYRVARVLFALLWNTNFEVKYKRS
nr:UDP-glucuronosyltransferase 2B15-like [Lytechinus pictus]